MEGEVLVPMFLEHRRLGQALVLPSGLTGFLHGGEVNRGQGKLKSVGRVVRRPVVMGYPALAGSQKLLCPCLRFPAQSPQHNSKRAG